MFAVGVGAFGQGDVLDVFDWSYGQPPLQQRHAVAGDYLKSVRDPYGCTVALVERTYPSGGVFVGIGDGGAFSGACMHRMLDW